mmetsp:Transcript_90714/g.194560  ORF Transcript_90714/g.194560 Transcript_90714/m.194560 type:complete len:224 (-) Transcript_90714:475-1146(-)
MRLLRGSASRASQDRGPVQLRHARQASPYPKQLRRMRAVPARSAAFQDRHGAAQGAAVSPPGLRHRTRTESRHCSGLSRCLVGARRHVPRCRCRLGRHRETQAPPPRAPQGLPRSPSWPALSDCCPQRRALPQQISQRGLPLCRRRLVGWLVPVWASPRQRRLAGVRVRAPLQASAHPLLQSGMSLSWQSAFSRTSTALLTRGKKRSVQSSGTSKKSPGWKDS